MTLAEELAARIAAARYEQLPVAALETAKRALLDTVGVTLAGANSDPARIVAASVGAGSVAGPALVFGQEYRTSILDAALINGTASHALDFDDCSNTLGGHPSVPILPALWALAEERGANGQDFLLAYIVGIETETRIGRAVNFHHYEKGWHPTSTLGVFGAAAACARLMKLDEDRIATALAIAASMASGLKANFGTMTKPFHVGQCARSGLLAALLASNGLTANHKVFEHDQGFLEVYNGRGNYDAERAIAAWGDPWDIIEPGIAFKRYPCCASTHPAIDALLELREEHKLDARNVRSLVSWTHPRRFKHTDRPRPASGFDGKFSVQYVLARALQRGFVSVNDFSDAAVREAEISHLLEKVIAAAPHPKATPEETNIYYAELTVETTDGRTLHKYVDSPVGRDRHHPLPEGALETKFDDCAGLILREPVVADVRERLLSLERENAASGVSALIERGLHHVA
ncbi:MAG: hypothetical protein RLZ98_9 [Pseudomonadota bacterium]|jgi:2-methylcitrate dehydratase PrpD